MMSIRPMKPTAFLTLALMLLVAACGGINLPGGEQGAQQVPPTSTPIPTAPAVARPTYLVQRGTVEEVLSFSGRWQPRDQLPLSFEIAGQIRQVKVRRNDTVHAGDLLADYQITDLENQLKSAELSLETAIANLSSGADSDVGSVADAEVALANAKLSLESQKANSPWTQTANAYNSLQDAKRNYDNAVRNYDDVRSRPESPPSSIEQAYNSVKSAESQVRNAEISYSSAAQSFNNYKFQLAQSENNVLQAQMRLDSARRGGGNPSQQQAVRSAQLQVDQIKANIARSSLYAPIDGQVLEVNIKPGDSAQAFASVIVIGKADPKEAIATLAIGDAQKLSVSLVGVCQVANKPETAVQCIVRRIPASARDADQTTRVAASFDELPIGTLIDIDMPLQVRENVLWLPPAAVQTFQNRTFVIIQTPDGQRVVDVVIGLRTDDRVEIKDGLNEGDVVVGP
ncbi:MAG: biotin/lipoyl-binding protein [Anaerolineae bacterium]|nr:biotin/lipoyl-binding protein [Anaerolineae bacterium]